MDSLTFKTQESHKAYRSPLHILHVYRHVDFEKVECSAQTRLDANKTRAFLYAQRSPIASVFHGEHPITGNNFNVGDSK
jgi:hypothetical protein